MASFWEKVRHYANKKVKREYMDRCRHDRKCPNCKLWISEVGGAYSIDYSDTNWLEVMECRQCHYKSVWDLRAMMPMLYEYQNSHTPSTGQLRKEQGE